METLTVVIRKEVQWVIKQAAKNAGVLKEVCVHTLRHTFATHLLEDGLDIISVKDLLGHERIETTMEYLHVVQNRQRVPLVLWILCLKNVLPRSNSSQN